MIIDPCAHCGTPIDVTAYPPGGTHFCNAACMAAWEEADPKRKEGWVKLTDLTPERARELFGGAGLDLQNGAGKVVPS
jgi:hypothetical protein